MLTPSESGSEFQQKYFAAMQESPEVVLAHSKLPRCLDRQDFQKTFTEELATVGHQTYGTCFVSVQRPSMAEAARWRLFRLWRNAVRRH